MFEVYLLIAILAATLLEASQAFLKKGLAKVPSLELEWKVVKRASRELLNNYFILAIILGFLGGLFQLVALMDMDRPRIRFSSTASR